MNTGLLSWGGRFESPLTVPATAAAVSLRFGHGLGRQPRAARWVLVCVRAEKGYQPGDEVPLVSLGTAVYVTAWANAQEVGVISTAAAYVVNRTNSTPETVTAKCWGIKAYAE